MQVCSALTINDPFALVSQLLKCEHCQRSPAAPPSLPNNSSKVEHLAHARAFTLQEGSLKQGAPESCGNLARLRRPHHNLWSSCAQQHGPKGFDHRSQGAASTTITKLESGPELEVCAYVRGTACAAHGTRVAFLHPIRL